MNIEIDHSAEHPNDCEHCLASQRYDKFIKNGLAVGFTDDQIDFLEEWIKL